MYTYASVHQLHQKSSETVENAFNSKSKINQKETASKKHETFQYDLPKLCNYDVMVDNIVVI